LFYAITAANALKGQHKDIMLVSHTVFSIPSFQFVRTPIPLPLSPIPQLFHEDIQYLLSMEKLWLERTPPTPLDLSTLSPHVHTGERKRFLEGGALGRASPESSQENWKQGHYKMGALFTCFIALRQHLTGIFS